MIIPRRETNRILIDKHPSPPTHFCLPSRFFAVSHRNPKAVHEVGNGWWVGPKFQISNSIWKRGRAIYRSCGTWLILGSNFRKVLVRNYVSHLYTDQWRPMYIIRTACIILCTHSYVCMCMSPLFCIARYDNIYSTTFVGLGWVEILIYWYENLSEKAHIRTPAMIL